MVNSLSNHGTMYTVIVLLLNVTLWLVANNCWDKYFTSLFTITITAGRVRGGGRPANALKLNFSQYWLCIRGKHTINSTVYDHNIDGLHSLIKDRQRERHACLQSASQPQSVDMFFFFFPLLTWKNIFNLSRGAVHVLDTATRETERARYSIICAGRKFIDLLLFIHATDGSNHFRCTHSMVD